jgi:hypothetical protein
MADDKLTTLQEIKDMARASESVTETLNALTLSVDTVSILHRIVDPVSGEYVDVVRQAGGQPYLYLVYDENEQAVSLEIPVELRRQLAKGGDTE